jgi:hypothetical protein
MGFSRPSGAYSFAEFVPALKRRAIGSCPSGTGVPGISVCLRLTLAGGWSLRTSFKVLQTDEPML